MPWIDLPVADSLTSSVAGGLGSENLAKLSLSDPYVTNVFAAIGVVILSVAAALSSHKAR